MIRYGFLRLFKVINRPLPFGVVCKISSDALKLLINNRNLLIIPSIQCASYTNARTPRQTEKNGLAIKLNDDNITLVKKSLNCSDAEAARYLNIKDYLQEPTESLRAKIDKLKSCGLKEETVLKNPYLLKNTLSDLTTKIQFMQHLKIPLNEKTVLLLAYNSHRRIVRAYGVDGTEYYKRIRYLSQELEADYGELFTRLHSKHLKLLYTSIAGVEGMITVLKNAGITATAIKNDLWVFGHNLKVAKDRLDRANAAKVPVKTWMVRCEQFVYDRTFIKWQNMYQVFGENSDYVTYLVKRLGCDRETVKKMRAQYSLKSTSALKLKEILDYLLEEGFAPEEIVAYPRILAHDLNKIQEHHTAYKALGLRPKCLLHYTYPKRMVEERLKRLQIKANKEMAKPN